MIFASVFLLDKPVFINSGNFLDGTGHIKRSRFKLSLFFLLITFSLGFACRIGYMAWPGMGQLGFQLSDQKLFIYLGMAAGPAVSALVSGKKGRLQQLRAADIPFRTCHRLRRLLFFRRLHVRSGEFRFRSFPVVPSGNMSSHDLLHVGSCLV